MHRQRTLPMLALIVAALAIATGCQDQSMGTVSGVITVNDQPTPGIAVEFAPQFDGGSSSTGVTDAEGKYELKFTAATVGAQVGKHTVYFESHRDVDDDGVAIPATKIPAKYAEDSEVTFEVKPGANTFDYNLEID